MNIENMNRLKAYISERKWRTEEWFDLSQCFCGMVRELTTGERSDLGSLEQVEAFLGITKDHAEGLITMTNPRGGGRADYFGFMADSVEGQNTRFLEALDGLEKGGEVTWRVSD